MDKMAECPWLERLEARGAARLIVERERMGLELIPIEELARSFGREELLDETNNLAIEEIARERLPAADAAAGWSFEQAARELGIDL